MNLLEILLAIGGIIGLSAAICQIYEWVKEPKEKEELIKELKKEIKEGFETLSHAKSGTSVFGIIKGAHF